MRHCEYFRNLLMILAIGGGLVSLTGCETEVKTGKFTNEQMDRFGQTQSMSLPGLTGGAVFSIGEETVTAEEVMLMLKNAELRKQRDVEELAKSVSMSDFREQFSFNTSEIVKFKVTNILLYEKAKSEAGDKIDEQLKKFVETEKNNFITRHGNNIAEAEKAFKRKGITDWKAFEDSIKGDMLRNMYFSKRTETTESVTYDQIKAHYEENKEAYKIEGSMVFLLIDIMPSKLKPELINIAMGQSAEAAAAELGKGLVKRIRNGEDFVEIAKKFSHGAHADTGGRDKVTYDGPENYGTLTKPRDVLEKLAEKMAVGEISDPVEGIDNDGEVHVLIMKLLEYEKRHFKSLGSVRNEIEREIEQNRRMSKENEIITEVMNETNTNDLEKFVDMCITQAYRQWSGKQR